MRINNMCKILISIKPEYSNKILEGEKTFEFRRRIPIKKVTSIIIYSSYPVGKVVGEAKVEEILEGSPLVIWKNTKESGGISKKKYFDYFDGTKQAYAYKLGKVVKYKHPRDLSFYEIDKAPQSFIYLN